jgi:hypothetical protein
MAQYRGDGFGHVLGVCTANSNSASARALGVFLPDVLYCPTQRKRADLAADHGSCLTCRGITAMSLFPSTDIGLRLREWTSDIEAFVELAGGVLERHSGFCNG